MAHGTIVYSKFDAMDAAESAGLVIEHCTMCGGYHFRDPKSQDEADQAGVTYRRELAGRFPELARRRGWIS